MFFAWNLFFTLLFMDINWKNEELTLKPCFIGPWNFLKTLKSVFDHELFTCNLTFRSYEVFLYNFIFLKRLWDDVQLSLKLDIFLYPSSMILDGFDTVFFIQTVFAYKNVQWCDLIYSGCICIIPNTNYAKQKNSAHIYSYIWLK